MSSAACSPKFFLFHSFKNSNVLSLTPLTMFLTFSNENTTLTSKTVLFSISTGETNFKSLNLVSFSSFALAVTNSLFSTNSCKLITRINLLPIGLSKNSKASTPTFSSSSFCLISSSCAAFLGSFCLVFAGAAGFPPFFLLSSISLSSSLSLAASSSSISLCTFS